MFIKSMINERVLQTQYAESKRDEDEAEKYYENTMDIRLTWTVLVNWAELKTGVSYRRINSPAWPPSRIGFMSSWHMGLG